MSVEYYRKRLIDLRADVAKEREAKMCYCINVLICKCLNYE